MQIAEKNSSLTIKGGDDMMLRRGRPVTLNRKRLEIKNGKNYAEMIFCGDWHYGHPETLVQQIKDMLDYCLKKKVYILLMGDLIECGITGSVGDSVYMQRLNPQEQVENVIEMLRPLANAGLIVGTLAGNHEYRIQKTTSIDVSKIMAGDLGIPYLGMACWNLFYVGDQSYSVYVLHGRSGSRFKHTKLKAGIDIAHYQTADLVAHAHVHDIATCVVERQYLNKTRKLIEIKKQYIILTGHYLGYQRSYAQAYGMPPGKVGSPKVKLFSNEFDIHTSE